MTTEVIRLGEDAQIVLNPKDIDNNDTTVENVIISITGGAGSDDGQGNVASIEMKVENKEYLLKTVPGLLGEINMTISCDPDPSAEIGETLNEDLQVIVAGAIASNLGIGIAGVPKV